MASSKPVGWFGSYDDQQELFLEILANITANKVLDITRRCMDAKLYLYQLPGLLFEQNYYGDAKEIFREYLDVWKVVYDPKTGILNQEIVKANGKELGRVLYATYLESIRPCEKVKKYTKVYEDLARVR
jgi:hypothetical protein